MVRVSLAVFLAVLYLVVATESVGAGPKVAPGQIPYPAICYPMANKTVVCLPMPSSTPQSPETMSTSPSPSPSPSPTAGPGKDG